MKEQQPNTIRHSWLTTMVHEQKDRLSHLLRSLSGFGPLDGMHPSIFQRFMRTMEQVHHARDDEKQLITQIDNIEEKHRQRRHRKLLREAPPVDAAPAVTLEHPEPEPKRSGLSFWWILFLLHFLSRPKPEHK